MEAFYWLRHRLGSGDLRSVLPWHSLHPSGVAQEGEHEVWRDHRREEVSESTTTIIEVNGVKMEVDLRQARVVHENLRVGSKVKILEKGGYGSPNVYAGVIVGFELFPDLPTIIVAYVKTGYSSPGLDFAYINAKSAEKWDMVPSMDDDLPVPKGDVLAHFDREANKKRAELDDITAKRDFFLSHFNRYFREETCR